MCFNEIAWLASPKGESLTLLGEISVSGRADGQTVWRRKTRSSTRLRMTSWKDAERIDSLWKGLLGVESKSFLPSSSDGIDQTRRRERPKAKIRGQIHSIHSFSANANPSLHNPWGKINLIAGARPIRPLSSPSNANTNPACTVRSYATRF